mgnify:FL=1
MTTYNWNCKTVDARPLEDGETNVVYNVHWVVTGTSDTTMPEGDSSEPGTTYSAMVIGAQNITWNPEGTFIPFEDLTNEIVVEWTKSAMGEEQVASIEASIQSQINALITPTSVALLIGGEMPGE